MVGWAIKTPYAIKETGRGSPDCCLEMYKRKSKSKKRQTPKTEKSYLNQRTILT